jgi:hypothetical protein
MQYNTLYNTVWTGGVAWLIKRGFGLETGFIRFDYNPQHITITRLIFNIFYLAMVVPSFPLG